jgi:non-specific serine/threonine protein kinase
VRRAHAAHFLALAERHERAAWVGMPAALLARFEADFPNLRAALTWLLAEGEAEAEGALRLAGALRWFWGRRVYSWEGRTLLELAYALRGAASPAARAKAAMALGQLVFFQGDEPAARVLYQDGLAAFRAAGDPYGTAFALSALGALAVYRGEPQRAAPLLTEALGLAAEPGDAELAASMVASITSTLGMAAYGQGDLVLAAARFQDALDRYRHLGYPAGVLRNLLVTGIVAGERGDPAEALARLSEALNLAWANGDDRGVAAILEAVTAVAAACGAPERAARIAGAAAAVRDRLGYLIRYPIDRDSYRRGIDAARRALGGEAFAAAWAAGLGLTIEQAIADVADVVPVAARRTAPTGLAARYGLTPREAEVLRLLAERQTDREIAAALAISHRTAQRHVSNLLGKLGVGSRREAGEIAARDLPH